LEKTKVVFYADDDVDDRGWVHDASSKLKHPLHFQFFSNGREVLECLKDKCQSLPALIVLDLNMPELDGRQTLQRLKDHPEYKEIPVAIVTTSANKIDIDVCKRLGASLFLIKPYTHVEWQNIIRQLEPLVN